MVFQLVPQKNRLVMWVNADGKDLRSFAQSFVEQRFQLSKLRRAVDSPVAAVEDEHDGFLAAIIGERDRLAILIFEGKIRRGVAGFDTV